MTDCIIVDLLIVSYYLGADKVYFIKCLLTPIPKNIMHYKERKKMQNTLKFKILKKYFNYSTICCNFAPLNFFYSFTSGTINPVYIYNQQNNVHGIKNEAHHKRRSCWLLGWFILVTLDCTNDDKLDFMKASHAGAICVDSQGGEDDY